MYNTSLYYIELGLRFFIVATTMRLLKFYTKMECFYTLLRHDEIDRLITLFIKLISRKMLQLFQQLCKYMQDLLFMLFSMPSFFLLFIKNQSSSEIEIISILYFSGN